MMSASVASGFIRSRYRFRPCFVNRALTTRPNESICIIWFSLTLSWFCGGGYPARGSYHEPCSRSSMSGDDFSFQSQSNSLVLNLSFLAQCENLILCTPRFFVVLDDSPVYSGHRTTECVMQSSICFFLCLGAVPVDKVQSSIDTVRDSIRVGPSSRMTHVIKGEWPLTPSTGFSVQINH